MGTPENPDVTFIAQLLSEGQSVPSRPGVLVQTPWSDSELDKLCIELKLPLITKSLTHQKGYLYNFFNFYFNGALPTGTSPHQIIYPILGSLMYEEGNNYSFYFPDNFYSDVGFYTPAPFPSSIPDLPISASPLSVSYEMPLGLDPTAVQTLQALYLDTTSINVNVFQTKIKELIRSYDSHTMTPENRRISRLAGFLALLLFRGIAKDATQLARGVNKKLIKDHIHNLAEWPVADSYAPPCKTCIEHCASDLDKGNIHSGRMMSLILKSWKDADESKRLSRGLIPRIQATLLTHTAGNGLGLVILMFVATEAVGKTIDDLMRHTITQNSKASWRVLANFVKTYMKPTNPERTYLWARLINDGYFVEFAARAHPYLSGIFAGIIDSQQTMGSIKQAAWFTLRKFQAEPGYKWGSAVIKKLSEVKDLPLTREGEDVLQYLPLVERKEAPVELFPPHDPFHEFDLDT